MLSQNKSARAWKVSDEILLATRSVTHQRQPYEARIRSTLTHLHVCRTCCESQMSIDVHRNYLPPLTGIQVAKQLRNHAPWGPPLLPSGLATMPCGICWPPDPTSGRQRLGFPNMPPDATLSNQTWASNSELPNALYEDKHRTLRTRPTNCQLWPFRRREASHHVLAEGQPTSNILFLVNLLRL